MHISRGFFEYCAHIVFIRLHICYSFLLCCVSIFDRGVNNPGRGVNVAVVNVDTMLVVKAIRYDTYQSSDGMFLPQYLLFSVYMVLKNNQNLKIFLITS